jgi:hypothetical protein
MGYLTPDPLSQRERGYLYTEIRPCQQQALPWATPKGEMGRGWRLCGTRDRYEVVKERVEAGLRLRSRLR